MTKKLNSLHRLIFIIATLLIMGAKSDIGRLTDPTEPPQDLMPANNSPVSWQSMTLSAIFIKSDNRIAIINGQSFHEGDSVGEYIITNITDSTVELLDSSKNKQVLQLVTNIKKAVPSKEE